MIKSIGIAIPCYNEEKFIEQCILSVVRSNYDSSNIKIVVADGLSTDNTRNIIHKLQEQYSNITIIDNPQRITPIALNLGLKTLQTDVKIILGAHSELHPDFISENIKALTSYPDAGCTGGLIENVYENSISEIIGKAMSSPFGVGNARFRIGGRDGYVDTVAFGAYRKEVFEEIGYFDETLVRNQDDEFNYRLKQNGFKVYFTEKIKSKYFVRSSYSQLFKQYYQYGYWKVFVNKKVGGITTARQLFPAILMFCIGLGAILSLFHIYFFFTWVLGLVTYVSMSLVFAIMQTKKPNEIFWVMLTFFVLHSSYGRGYLKGILDFLILNKQPQNKHKKISR